MTKDYFFASDDELDRLGYAKFLRNLIEHCDNHKRDETSEAYSIAIDSSWGTGKTYFFNMFENYLYGQENSGDPTPEGMPEFIVVNYNAWSNDYWDDAFAPFMQAILDNDRFVGADWKNKLRRLFENIIANSGQAPAKIYTSYRQSDPLVHLRQKQKAIQDLKDCLKKMILSCKGLGLKKLVIIIDELDRCKPLFAIQTLEIVKHFLDVKDVVFIFAIDLEQLSHSIETIYGSGMDAAGYLCKFFDYITKFPQVQIDEVLRNFFSVNQMKPLKSANSDGRSHDPDFEFFKFITELFSWFQLSIRDLYTILQSYKIMLESFLDKYVLLEAHQAYLFLLVLKYKFPNDFRELFFIGKKSPYISSPLQAKINNSSFSSSIAFLLELIWNNQKIELKTGKAAYVMSSLSFDRPKNALSGSRKFNDLYDCVTVTENISDDYMQNYIFYPDIAYNLEHLKSATYLTYYFRHLENFNFSEFTTDSKG